MDGLVRARSAFHHSVNYRSVVIFSDAEKVTDENELYKALEVFTNKMQPGRWAHVRKPCATVIALAHAVCWRMEGDHVAFIPDQ